MAARWPRAKKRFSSQWWNGWSTGYCQGIWFSCNLNLLPAVQTLSLSKFWFPFHSDNSNTSPGRDVQPIPKAMARFSHKSKAFCQQCKHFPFPNFDFLFTATTITQALGAMCSPTPRRWRGIHTNQSPFLISLSSYKCAAITTIPEFIKNSSFSLVFFNVNW